MISYLSNFHISFKATESEPSEAPVRKKNRSPKKKKKKSFNLNRNVLLSQMKERVEEAFAAQEQNVESVKLNPDSNLIGIRIPDHPFIRGVCREIQLPLALTSANISNTQSALSIEEFSELHGHLSCIIDGGTLGLNEHSRLGSTVIDLSNQGSYQIIRAGSAENQTVAKLKKFGIQPK